jgi:4'-phosphopantetheinyl transferase
MFDFRFLFSTLGLRIYVASLSNLSAMLIPRFGACFLAKERQTPYMEQPPVITEAISDPDAAFASLAHEAHVWLARPAQICDPDYLERYGALLSSDELAREERFINAELRQLFRISHALVRTTLSRYARVSPSDWKFQEGAHGRPEIIKGPGIPALRFNLSHTKGLVACIATQEIDCGIDVERVGRVKNLEGVARRVFSDVELEDLLDLSGADREGRFTDFWVLKEAYIKARGMGFQLPLRDIQFRILEDGAIELDFAPGFADNPLEWQLHLQNQSYFDEPMTAFRLGVALRRGGSTPRSIIVRDIVPLSGEPL